VTFFNSAICTGEIERSRQFISGNRKHEKAARRTHNMNPLGLSVGNL